MEYQPPRVDGIDYGRTAEPSSTLNLPSLQDHSSLRDQVTRALRAALIAGELRPGVVYSAPTLAAHFRVSATPVREAMLDLAKEGLIEIARNKGFRVVPVSARDLDEYTEIRILIEVPLTVRVTRTADRASLEALRPAVAESIRAAESGDLLACMEADREFHVGLLALAGSRYAVDVVDNLRKRSRLCVMAGLAESGQLLASVHDHVRILDLAIAGDAAGVERLLSEHLGQVRSLWHRPSA